MTSPLDDISFQLGQLTAGVAILRERAEKRDTQNEQIMTQLGEIKTRMKPLAEDVAKMKPDVAHYRSIRGNVVWVGSATWAIAVLVGTAAMNWAFRKFGGS